MTNRFSVWQGLTSWFIAFLLCSHMTLSKRRNLFGASFLTVLIPFMMAPTSLGFSGGSVVKKSTCWCRGCGFNPWAGKIPWKRNWQPSIFLPRKFHGQTNLVGYSPWGHKRVRHDLVTKKPPLWPNHLPVAPPPKTTTLEVRLQNVNSG